MIDCGEITASRLIKTQMRCFLNETYILSEVTHTPALFGAITKGQRVFLLSLFQSCIIILIFYYFTWRRIFPKEFIDSVRQKNEELYQFPCKYFPNTCPFPVPMFPRTYCIFPWNLSSPVTMFSFIYVLQYPCSPVSVTPGTHISLYPCFLWYLYVPH